MAENLALCYAQNMAQNCDDQLDRISEWFKAKYLAGQFVDWDIETLAESMILILQGEYSPVCPTYFPTDLVLNEYKGHICYTWKPLLMILLTDPRLLLIELFKLLEDHLPASNMLMTLNRALKELRAIYDHAVQNELLVAEDSLLAFVLDNINRSIAAKQTSVNPNHDDAVLYEKDSALDPNAQNDTQNMRISPQSDKIMDDDDPSISENSDNAFSPISINGLLYRQSLKQLLNYYFNFDLWVKFIQFIIKIYNHILGPLLIYIYQMYQYNNRRGQHYELRWQLQNQEENLFNNQVTDVYRNTFIVILDNKTHLPLNWKLTTADNFAVLEVNQQRPQAPAMHHVRERRSIDQFGINKDWLGIVFGVMLIQIFLAIFSWIQGILSSDDTSFR